MCSNFKVKAMFSRKLNITTPKCVKQFHIFSI